MKLVRNTVGFEIWAATSPADNLPVSRFVPPSYPDPTIVWPLAVNLLPETFGECSTLGGRGHVLVVVFCIDLPMFRFPPAAPVYERPK